MVKRKEKPGGFTFTYKPKSKPINTKLINEKEFWSLVDVKGVDECWLWKGCYMSGGYGNFHDFTTHTVSYIIKNGKIPEGKEICHKCNNSKCVNPNHLYAGTHADNMKDIHKKYIHKKKWKELL